MYDGEQGILLHAMQRNRASSQSEREVSWFFSSYGGNLGYVLNLQRGQPLETFVCSATSGLLSRYDGHLRNLNYAWQYNTDAFVFESGDRGSLSSWKSDIRIPVHFQKESGIVTFEALNSVCLSRYQRDVIPPVQMRRRPSSFSRVSSEDSDIPSSCDMKTEPALKPLQGNLTLFFVSESRYPLHLGQQT